MTATSNRKRTAPVFQPGATLGGVTVSECLNPSAAINQRRYVIFYDCCDTKAQLSHYSMLRRQEQHLTRCSACQRRARAELERADRRAREAEALAEAEAAEASTQHTASAPANAAKQRPARLSDSPAKAGNPDVFIDRFGHHWPHLGRLGPRWGAGTTKLNQIATGKEKR